MIQVRWIDINKGDVEKPDYRSRLVAKQFKRKGSAQEWFAATPPTEALRLMLSEAASQRTGEEPVMVTTNDVKRAYSYARVQTPICIELPPEDMSAEDMEEDNVGELLLSMCGTRAAAAA